MFYSAFLFMLLASAFFGPALAADDSGQTHTLPLHQLDFDGVNPDQLRSSVYYSYRTDEALDIYHEEFEDHRAIRIDAFAWAANNSTNLEEFADHLQHERALVQTFADSNDKIIIMIAGTPLWLSSSTDETILESGWAAYRTCSPASETEWVEAIVMAAEFYSTIEDAEIYFEFWNEPDFDYYWSEDIESFLNLYKLTSLALREAFPQCKIGGPALNWWDGTIGDSEDYAMEIFLEFATSNNLPLDFLSWHHYTSDATQVVKGRDLIEAKAQEIGIEMPELVVTEWGPPRATRSWEEAVPMIADGLYYMKQTVDIQTFSAWENFHSGQGIEGYGLLADDGVKKTAFYAYQAFDQFSRGATGVYQTSNSEGRRLMLAQKPNGRYTVIVWENRDEPRTSDVILDFIGDGAIKVSECRVIWGGLEDDYGSFDREAAVNGETVTCELQPNELMILEVESLSKTIDEWLIYAY